VNGIGLRTSQLSSVFPFYVAFDSALQILEVGAAWQRVSPSVCAGAFLPECFRLTRPELPLTRDTVASNLDSLITIECLAKPLALRGQMVSVGEAHTLLIARPWVRSEEELSRLGLRLGDWPAHDEAGEYLFLLQGRETALSEARELTRRLTDQREHLRSTSHALDLAVRAREATEQHMRLIVDTALDAVVSMDRTGVVTSWNAQAVATFGWSREEALGRPMKELVIPPHLHEAHERGMERYLRTGEARVLNQRIEVVARDRTGREFPAELSITPIREGESLSFSAFIRDISVAKRREGLLHSQAAVTQVLASEAPLADVALEILKSVGELLGWATGGLWMLDPRIGGMRCVQMWHRPEVPAQAFVAQSRERVFLPGVGIPGRVLVSGKPEWVTVLPDDETFPRFASAREAGLTSAVALPLTLAGSTQGVMEFFSQETVQPNAEALATLSGLTTQVGQFIERAQARAARAEAEARRKAVIEEMLEGLAVLDSDLRIVEANPALARMFGYPREQLIGLTAMTLVPHSAEHPDPAAVAARLQQALGRVTQHEGSRRSGELFPMEVRLYEVVAPEGRLIAAHIRDLSSERSADRIKKEFVATISHELRTPLTAIRGALGLLNAGAVGVLPPDAANVLGIAERNAVRLVGLVEDILDFERLQSGRLSVSPVRFPLDRAVTRALESMTAQAAQAEVTLVTPTTGLEIMADEPRIVQVLVNLFSNAVKFSPRGSAVDLTAVPHRDAVEVRVRDRGRGVPDHLRTVIFEPFRQSEPSDARAGGLGLGLAICRAILRQHGGDIGVEPAPGGGSTFFFTLPTESDEGRRGA